MSASPERPRALQGREFQVSHSRQAFSAGLGAHGIGSTSSWRQQGYSGRSVLKEPGMPTRLHRSHKLSGGWGVVVVDRASFSRGRAHLFLPS